MRLAVLILGLCACVTSAFAQDYRIRQFTVEDGLPSDIIKDISEDSLGFIWIACDEGLVKFDGFNFTPYKEALHSQYAKGFLRRDNKQLLAFADLDVVRIDNRLDTVVFDRVLAAMRNVTDSALWYPKSMVEDSAGNFWFGEPEAITRWDGKKSNDIPFPSKSHRYFSGPLQSSKEMVISMLLPLWVKHGISTRSATSLFACLAHCHRK
ncbi:MAG: hypothetical protein HC859_14285 [Bacteroidia bacterium]|nr:hypothetical protein [Bacteroidia bacterium]